MVLEPHSRIKSPERTMENKIVSLDVDYSRLQTYHIRAVILLRYLILAILGIGGTLVILFVGLSRWRFALTNFGPAVLWRWINPIVWIGIGFGLIGAIGLFLFLRVARQEIQISPEAFTWKKGRNLTVYRWEDIHGIYVTSVHYGIFDFAWAKKKELTLHLVDGERIKINQDFENIEKLMAIIKHYVYPVMFEQFRQEFNRGEPLSFGPLLLTSRGVMNGRKTLRWQEIGEISVEGGSLQLQPIDRSNHPNFSVPIQKIPNVDLCIQLLHHFGPQT